MLEENPCAMKKALLFALLSTAAFAADAKQYSMVLTVVSTKSVPFRSGAQSGSQTDCYINGNNINCNTTDTSFSGIPGVSFLMLAKSTDGNTYLFGCDAQWRWSHCTGLQTGKFHARMDGGSLAIEYLDRKGKPKEGKYRIFSMETMPTSAP